MSARGDIVARVIALLGLATGVAALALILVLWSRVGGRPAEPRVAAPASPDAQSAAPPALAGRRATLSRLLSERRAVARIELGFGPNGALEIACRAEAADGAETPCFDAEKGAGAWSQSGAKLCVSAAVLKLAPDTCYELAGQAPNLTLAGPGLLAGNMFLR
jgi:hypothetical protein